VFVASIGPCRCVFIFYCFFFMEKRSWSPLSSISLPCNALRLIYLLCETASPASWLLCSPSAPASPTPLSSLPTVRFNGIVFVEWQSINVYGTSTVTVLLNSSLPGTNRTVATGVPNTGRYLWNVSGTVPNLFFNSSITFRIAVRSEQDLNVTSWSGNQAPCSFADHRAASD